MLRLVQPDVILDLQATRELRVEIDTLEALYGKNPYSDYLRRHGRRPDPCTAATIGRVLGGRVEADDGSMQPRPTAADRRALKENKLRRQASARRYEQIARFKEAISALAQITDDPAEVIGDGRILLDDPNMVAQLDLAVCWLKRFAEHWHGRAQKTSAKKQSEGY